MQIILMNFTHFSDEETWTNWFIIDWEEVVCFLLINHIISAKMIPLFGFHVLECGDNLNPGPHTSPTHCYCDVFPFLLYNWLDISECSSFLDLTVHRQQSLSNTTSQLFSASFPSPQSLFSPTSTIQSLLQSAVTSRSLTPFPSDINVCVFVFVYGLILARGIMDVISEVFLHYRQQTNLAHFVQLFTVSCTKKELLQPLW